MGGVSINRKLGAGQGRQDDMTTPGSGGNQPGTQTPASLSGGTAPPETQPVFDSPTLFPFFSPSAGLSPSPHSYPP